MNFRLQVPGAHKTARALVVEERHTMRNCIDVFHQPVVEFAADARRELAN